MLKEVSDCYRNDSKDLITLLPVEMTGGYTYKQNAQEIFENFFGTNNPFAAFGFETMPFASKLNKPGPTKAKPITFDLECSLKGN